MRISAFEHTPLSTKYSMCMFFQNEKAPLMETSVPRELVIHSEMLGDKEIRVTVEDHGTCLTPEVAARMFDPFFSTKAQGTGMGLAICRSIVEAHDGRIWASKPANNGTMVHFTIRVRP
jgi:two-component system sensor kinase FixL